MEATRKLVNRERARKGKPLVEQIPEVRKLMEKLYYPSSPPAEIRTDSHGNAVVATADDRSEKMVKLV